MRQRNDSDYPLTVHTQPPQTVHPGDVVDHDDPLIGLTVLDQEPDEDETPVDEPTADPEPDPFDMPEMADADDEEVDR